MGKLLGDGHLETANGRTYRLKIEHSLKQKDYVLWAYNELKNMCPSEPKIKVHKRGNNEYKKSWFNTSYSGSLRFYYQQFYKNEKKIVPKLIHRWLTPLTLAVWFMDDGSIKSSAHKARILNTQSFTKEEIEKLIKTLKEKFDLQSKLRRQKEGYQIMILSESADRFAKLIQEYIIPSMKYKLKGLGQQKCPKCNGGVYKGRLGPDGNRIDSANA